MHQEILRKLENSGLLTINDAPAGDDFTLVVVSLTEPGSLLARNAVLNLGLPPLPSEVAPHIQDREGIEALRQGSSPDVGANSYRGDAGRSKHYWVFPYSPDQLVRIHDLLGKPRYVILLSDLVATTNQGAVRSGSVLEQMRDGLAANQAILRFLDDCKPTALLASTGKARREPAAFSETLKTFCNRKPELDVSNSSAETATDESRACSSSIDNIPAAGNTPNQRSLASRTKHKPMVFLHIPKTAGTSLRQLLRQQLPGNALAVLDPPISTELRAKTIRLLPHMRVLIGHLYFGVDEHLGFHGDYGTFLRDPVARVVSFWRHQLAHEHSEYHKLAARGMTLREFVASGITHQTDNFMTRILVGTAAPGMLDGTLNRIDDQKFLDIALENVNRRFRFVGFVEYFDESIRRLVDLFGWLPQVQPPIKLNVSASTPPILDEATLKVINEHNRLDLALYDCLLQQSPWATRSDAPPHHGR
ncbi:MAG: sulfotransferase family 2 domain-containing protein [Chromatiaceae bacterium]|nr:sulfotransferase family 2 domain-containing protein [Chromatiaceae bacterium]MCP5315392.1 sulfotransferase family 2 domain-containing protein [Chromatiaceae bacterium]